MDRKCSSDAVKLAKGCKWLLIDRRSLAIERRFNSAIAACNALDDLPKVYRHHYMVLPTIQAIPRLGVAY